ncbi:hypothetical protein QBC45DRAFT_416413 [Copromyces sp. CBS 386.78]|nr:hypothetical protein QBC45DRAFT_416413 [Copromyces sp. CBS 386.78]
MLQDADEVKKIAAAAEALRTANDYALSAFLESTQLEWVQRWLEVFDLIFSIQDPVHDRGVEPNPLTGNIFKEILKTQEVFKQRSRVLAVSEIDEYNPESQPAGSSMTISNYGRGVYIGEWDYPGWLTGWNWDQKNPDQPSLFHEALEEEGRNPSKEEQIRRIEEDSLSDIQDALDASGKPRRSTRRRMVAQGQADEKKDRDWEERQRRYDKERRQRRKEYGKVKKNSKKEKDKKEKESTSVRR